MASWYPARCVVCDDRGCEHCPAVPRRRFRLIFRTPSRNCPLRRFNGQECEITHVFHGRNVRRMRNRYSAIYGVKFPGYENSYAGVLADELHIEPTP